MWNLQITYKKGPSSQGYGFSSGHVWIWELDYKASWVPRNWWFWTVVLEKTLESPLDGTEIQPVHSERDLSWVFIGRTDAEAETPILWPPDVKSWRTGKDPDAGKDWGQEEKRVQRMSQLDGITDLMSMNLSILWRQWRTKEFGLLLSRRVRWDLATERQQQGTHTVIRCMCVLPSDYHDKTVSIHPFPSA